MKLKDKKIFVTGGSRGLGQCLCVNFAKAGAKVAFNYASDDEGAKQTLDLINEYSEGKSYKVNVRERDEVEKMAEDIFQTWDGIDILVNNAGTTQSYPIAMIDDTDWDHVMGLNVDGSFIATTAFLKGMIRKKAGHILNVGSLAGVKLLESPVHYSTSKAALKGFTESLAKECAQFGIRVNCIAPGLLDDGIARTIPEHRLKDYTDFIGLHRLGELDEVASLAVHMLSEDSNYMNAATLVIDGGF